jgi:ATP-binding cassette subfamily F protein 3
MLLADPDFLVLDEPTNFLDLTTGLLLQDFLVDFRGGVIVVSHDREFLRASCDHTLLVERGGLTMYPGNIEEFFVWKAEQMELARRTKAAVDAKRKHLQSFVDRFGAKASKASQARSKQKQIERLKPVTIANPLATARVMIPKAGGRPGLAIATEDLTIGYPDHTIATEIGIAIDRGDKVAIVGDNGEGKTTLLRTLANDLPTLSGRVRLGHEIEISYYAQHVYQTLDPTDTVFEHLESCAPRDVTRQQVLQMAGALLFRGDDVEKRISVLSGGERARVCLAGLLLAKKPVLILDEPTNHLDFETVEALGEALRDFDGAVLFVSHDRTFVNMAATQIVEVDKGHVRRLPGSYADYVEQSQIRARAASAPRKKSRDRSAATKKGGTPAATPQHARAEERRRNNARKSAQRELRQVERRMEQLEARKADLHTRIASDAADPELYTQLAEVEGHLAAVEPEWLALSARLESLAA